MGEAAKKAAKAEVRSNGHQTITDRGVTFTIPEKIPLDAAEAAEDGRLIAFIREMVGPDEYAQWKLSFAPRRPVIDDLTPLATKLGEPYGFKSVGESSASSDS